MLCEASRVWWISARNHFETHFADSHSLADFISLVSALLIIMPGDFGPETATSSCTKQFLITEIDFLQGWVLRIIKINWGELGPLITIEFFKDALNILCTALCMWWLCFTHPVTSPRCSEGPPATQCGTTAPLCIPCASSHSEVTECGYNTQPRSSGSQISLGIE